MHLFVASSGMHWREWHHKYVSQSQHVPSLGLDHQGPHPDSPIEITAIFPHNTAQSRENQIEVIKLGLLFC